MKIVRKMPLNTRHKHHFYMFTVTLLRRVSPQTAFRIAINATAINSMRMHSKCICCYINSSIAHQTLSMIWAELVWAHCQSTRVTSNVIALLSECNGKTHAGKKKWDSNRSSWKLHRLLHSAPVRTAHGKTTVDLACTIPITQWSAHGTCFPFNCTGGDFDCQCACLIYVIKWYVCAIISFLLCQALLLCSCSRVRHTFYAFRCEARCSGERILWAVSSQYHTGAVDYKSVTREAWRRLKKKISVG